MNSNNIEKWKRLDVILKENHFRIIYSVDGEIHNYGNDATFDRFEYNIDSDTLTIYNYNDHEIECLHHNILSEETIKLAIYISLYDKTRYNKLSS